MIRFSVSCLFVTGAIAGLEGKSLVLQTPKRSIQLTGSTEKGFWVER